MSVEITLAFDTAEEAIVALGKLVGIKGRKNPGATAAAPTGQTASTAPGNGEVAPTPTATSAVPVPPAVPTRRPGRPRGSANRSAEKPVETPQPVVPAVETPVATSAETAAPAAAIATPPTPAPAAAVPTEEDVQKAVEKIFTAKDYDGTLALLQRFGVKRGKDLPADQRANFINRVAGVLERGEAI